MITLPAFDEETVQLLKEKIKNRSRQKGRKVKYFPLTDPDLIKAVEGMKKFE